VAPDDDPDAPEQAHPRDAVAVVFDAVGVATRLGLGAMGAVEKAVRSRGGRRDDRNAGAAADTGRTPVDVAEVLALAAIGIGAEITGRALAAAATAASVAERGGEALLHHRPLRQPIERLTTAAQPWNDGVRKTLTEGERLATDQGLDLAARIATKVMDRIDVDAVVDRVDLDRILARVNVDEIAARLDVDAVASRLDLERLIQRLDLTAIAQGVIDELDLAAIAQSVIDELELGEIIRESTGTVTVEAVDAIRVGGMNADRLVTRFVDRLLMRRNGAAHDPPSGTSDLADQ
jgi:hypothetical protein